MKIAFVYDAVYPWVKGGAEKRVYEIGKRLANRGHEVHWYGIGWWWPEKGQRDIKFDGIHLHGVSGPLDLYAGDRRSIKEAIYFALKLFPKLMGEKFDIIDCQGFPFFSCFITKIHSLLGKSTLIITLHEVWNEYWYDYLGMAGFFGMITEKATVNLTDKIISVSVKTKRDLKEIKTSERSIVISNGIDFEYIMEIKASQERSDIIFAGRLVKEKNVDFLIEAVSIIKERIPDIKCFIVGDGPERRKLEKLTEKLGIQENVIFKGFVEDHNDLISYMKSSKVFVLPSEREGFGIVVLEANACGLPVITVNHKMNAASDLIINNKNGFVASFSSDDIAEKTVDLIYKKEKIEENCIKMAKMYDWNSIVDSLERYYMSIADSF